MPNPRRTFLVWLILSLLVAGCAKVGPDYVRPETKVSPDWLEAGDQRVKTDPAEYRNWWKVFNDIALDHLIDTAYRENLTLRQAGVRVLEAGDRHDRHGQSGGRIRHAATGGNGSPRAGRPGGLPAQAGRGGSAPPQRGTRGPRRRPDLGDPKAYETAKAERQRFNDVLEMLPAYVILLSPDYHVPFANRYFEERFGKSKGRRCYEYLFHRAEPCENCETYKVLKTGSPTAGNGPGRTAATTTSTTSPSPTPTARRSSWKWGSTSPSASGPRRRSGRSTRRWSSAWPSARRRWRWPTRRPKTEKRLLEAVMDALPVGVAVTDTRGGNVKANRAFEEVWGGPRAGDGFRRGL